MKLVVKKISDNEVIGHLVVSVIYLLLISIVKFELTTGLALVWFGGLIGTYLLDIDHLLYWLYVHPEKEDSKKAKEILLRVRGVRLPKLPRLLKETGGELYRLLQEYHSTHNRLIFHTIIFQVILLVLAVFILSSSNSFFGAGLILTMNLHLLKDVWQDYFVKGKERLADWFLWQIRGFGLENRVKEYLIASSLVFGLITLLFV